MRKNWYKLALEAVGMCGRRAAIHNRLNAIVAHSDDPKLRQLVVDAMRAFDATSTNPQVLSMRDMRGVPTQELEAYCRARAYPPPKASD